MAFIRNCIITAVMFFCIATNAKAQTVYYPVASSPLLKATAEDAAMLLQKAMPGSLFTTQAYNVMPSTGIVFIYDSTITDNQACKVQSNGTNQIIFTAAEDNGLHFGIYQYLHQLGYRFYQPGSVWEITPTLLSAYKKIDTIYTCNYKYKSWYVSGGYTKWAMDNNDAYSWDTYFGDNGHNWALYQRRNGMLGSANFIGHRGDVMTGDYLATIKSNPCYVANYNGSRVANSQSVPDIFNTAAKELWANTIEQKFTQYKNIIYGNTSLYANFYRNFRYGNSYMGIEVPDGAQWGNSKDNDACGARDYPKPSDQNFALANATVQKIAAKYPNKRFQLYAYSTHADVPSASIAIDKNIDVQLIATVYQMESSTNGLRNRWYNRTSNVSEYLYLNLSGWSGETPSFKWSDLKQTLQIAKEKKSQGIMWEASPAKFGSLPFLLASDNFLKENIEVDSTLHEFCDNMFATANNTVYKIFKMWGEEGTAPGKYTMQLYLQLLNTAEQQTQNAADVVKQRLRELKAYLHYMVLYFDLANDYQDKSVTAQQKDAAKCMYIAKTNKMQLVNSYYMIATIVSKYATASDFYAKYNVANGTAYQSGNLPLITNEEIDNNFIDDVNKYSNLVSEFNLQQADQIKPQFKAANIAPLAIINTTITFTNGMDYYNNTNFNIVAPAAGTFTIKYAPHFYMADKGFINFTVESLDKTLQIVKDITLDKNSAAGSFTIDLPQAGNYVLTVISKYQSAVDLSITTNGNYFYKSGVFLGNKTESYKTDAASMPGYFYIPNGISKVYCTIPNSFYNGKYAGGDDINKTFLIKDANGNAVQLRFVTPKDSSLMYLEIPESAAGTFWQVTSMVQYNLQFITISNVLWFAKRTGCSSANFSATVINKDGLCITRLTCADKATGLTWKINDDGQILKYSNQNIVDLPASVSAAALITLTNGTDCSFSKRLDNDEKYLSERKTCGSSSRASAMSVGDELVTNTTLSPVMYPNPSTGIFNCMQNGKPATADRILIYNSQGTQVGSFKNAKQFSLSNSAAGLYVYQLVIKGTVYKGKIMKI